MAVKLEWEQIDPNTKRAKVFGGWIIVIYGMQRVKMQVRKNQTIALKAGSVIEMEEIEKPLNGLLSAVFVPDANWQWEIK